MVIIIIIIIIKIITTTIIIIIINSKIDVILIAKLSHKDTIFLVIIHKNLRFFAIRIQFKIDDQIENYVTKTDGLMRFVKCGRILTYWTRNYFFNFSTPCT